MALGECITLPSPTFFVNANANPFRTYTANGHRNMKEFFITTALGP